MPLGTSFRRSIPYLYVKAYGLSTLVSIFASTPISRRIPIERLKRWEQLRKRGEERIRLAKLDLEKTEIGKKIVVYGESTGYRFRDRRLEEKDERKVKPSYEASERSDRLQARSNSSDSRTLGAADWINREKDASLPLPFSALSLQIPSDSTNHSPRLDSTPKSSISDVLKRWFRRGKELAEIRKLMKRDDQDEKTFPEINWDAEVRRSYCAHPAEVSFLASRCARMLSTGSFASFLQLSPEEVKDLDPQDIPIIGVGGSGGGYRAMIGYAAFLDAFQERGAWDLISYLAGVSGSCWTIHSLYTISSLSPAKLLAHYRKVASENLHPMSRSALDVVARTKKGSYFLLAPLLRKAESGIVGLGIMDLYATMLNSYQLLSRDPHPPARLSRATFQWSKIWERTGIDSGKAPLPILTAVRLVHPEKKKKGRKSIPNEKDENLGTGVVGQEETSSDPQQGPKPSSKFHWYEISPLEFGSVDAKAFIPTWALGRSFRSGKSLSRSPEISSALILGKSKLYDLFCYFFSLPDLLFHLRSLLLGMVTSAPAGPLTGYVSALLATLPNNTIMSNLLNKLNDFVKMSRWERRWGNPIRESSLEVEILPTWPKLYLPYTSPYFPLLLYLKGAADEPNPFYSEWESSGRIKLMDAGNSNNSPSHVLYNSVRKADIIVNFDASSDVQSGSGLTRMFDFGRERGLNLELAPLMTSQASRENVIPARHPEECSIEGWRGRHTVILNGWRDSQDCERPPDLRMLYCPLLPNKVQPNFNPATAPWSTSYNLIWQPEQVDVLAKAASANAEIVVEELRKLVKETWKAKREMRLRSKEAESREI